MSHWIDLLLVVLALSVAWLGWVLLRLAQATSALRRRALPQAVATSRAPLTVAKVQAVDSEL